jgi:hypothetical protein
MLVAALAAAAPGCIAAAAAAGAGGAVYVTSRGAESLVEGQPSDIAGKVPDAFGEFGITQTGTSTENGGDKQQFKGTNAAGLEITVDLERRSPSTTRVEVTARKNVAEWDKDLARQILDRFVRD